MPFVSRPHNRFRLRIHEDGTDHGQFLSEGDSTGSFVPCSAEHHEKEMVEGGKKIFW